MLAAVGGGTRCRSCACHRIEFCPDFSAGLPSAGMIFSVRRTLNVSAPSARRRGQSGPLPCDHLDATENRPLRAKNGHFCMDELIVGQVHWQSRSQQLCRLRSDRLPLANPTCLPRSIRENTTGLPRGVGNLTWKIQWSYWSFQCIQRHYTNPHRFHSRISCSSPGKLYAQFPWPAYASSRFPFYKTNANYPPLQFISMCFFQVCPRTRPIRAHYGGIITGVPIGSFGRDPFVSIRSY